VTTSELDAVDPQAVETDPGAGTGGGIEEVDWGDPGEGGNSAAANGGQGAAPVVDPKPSRLVEVPLGDLAEGESSSFEVTTETLGFSAVIHSPTPHGTMGLEHLEAPDGSALVEAFRIDRPQWEVWWYGTTVASVPQTDAPSAMPRVMPGAWSLRIGDLVGAGSSADVTVWRRETDDGAFHGGWLDVNVLIAGTSSTEAYLRPVIESAFHGYAGLHLGTVEFFNIDAKYEVIDENNFIAAVRETEVVTTAPALNVIVTADFAGWLEGAAGVAAGIPGQALEHGTGASAVVVEHFGAQGVEIDTLRHEAGHLAGLFHTTELDGLGVDPLGETPECGDIETMLLSCPDVGNLMFPVLVGGSPQLSPQQHRVIEGSTLYRAELIRADGDAAPAEPAAPQPSDHDHLHAEQPTATAAQHRSLTLGAAWVDVVGAEVAALLHAGWCAPHPRSGRRLELYRALELAGADPETLVSLGARADAPAHVRKRALRAAGRLLATPSSDDRASMVAAMDALARDPGQPRAVRMGSLTAVRHASPTCARQLARTLERDADTALATLAHR
jgi:hypothetical protein